MPAELQHMTIHELGRLLRTRAVSAIELVRMAHERMDATAEITNTFISQSREAAEAAAHEADRRIAAGRAGPLTGIPIAVKDNICAQGLAATCGSRMLEHFNPPYDATVVERLRSGGAVIMGKTNMDEFAMGSSTETSFSGPCRNPWNIERVAGGSSGGSAAAVAAGQCVASLGTDTGGSIRQPAALCGIVGLKPTFGRVSRFGLVAFASSLDHIGPLTRDVRDAAILLGAISGHDRRDSTSSEQPVPDFEEDLSRGVNGMRLGVPREYFDEHCAPDTASAIQQALRVFEGAGAVCVPVSLPHTRYTVATYYLIATAEASSNLARYDGVAYGYRSPDCGTLHEMYQQTRSAALGPEVKRRIMLGTYALSAGYYDACYKKASQVRSLILRDFQEAFQHCDVIIAPATPGAAYRLGEKTGDPLDMYCDDVFTVPVNLAGLPAMSVPCGFTAEGLPVGMQIIGNMFQESDVLRCGHCYEQKTEWHLRKAPLQQPS
jgi:aspartyl-tRNA(Asn)/glutamyl-tRNA(Gln) amidotransferase subunit A